MRPPKCKLYEPASRYPRKVVRSLHFDGSTLSIDIQGEGFAFARLVFGPPVWFRVLDECDLCEFWPAYSEPNGWLWEVQEGGWLELEAERALFSSPSMYPDLREFLLVDDQCVSILAVHPPHLHDLGAEPLPAAPGTLRCAKILDHGTRK